MKYLDEIYAQECGVPYNKDFPMYIQKIEIKKFRHLENETLGPFGINRKTTDLIAFAGPNGSGKSSVLELIGYALSNSYSLSWSLPRTFKDFSFEVGIGLSEEEKILVINALSEEMSKDESSLKEQIELIESDLKLSTQTKEAQKTRQSNAHEQQQREKSEVINYLRTNSVYYRAFNYDAGGYGVSPTLQNRLHNYVTRELKDVLKRSLGFFLRADRHYPQKGFEQHKIFSYGNVIRREHLWTMAFNTSEIQYQDMYEFLVQQRYHYLRALGSYHNRRNRKGDEGEEPSDPLIPYEELLNRIFPDYEFVEKNEDVPSNLFIKIPSGEVITFNDLSSGEKEVFFILSFFIRHNVENAIIVIDEPELHLHPELSRLLIRNMKSIRNGNQIWVATHNSEIIDEAGRDRVIYVARDLSTRMARFIGGGDEQEVVAQLRNLFGLSGYIGVARNLVFLEGDNSSQDRKFFSALFPGSSSNFKLVPSNSCGSLTGINNAIMAIVESSLGWMKFFLIRDRDYLTQEMVQKYQGHKGGKVFVLERHEIENYLLNFEAISKVLSEIFGVSRSAKQVREIFYDEALRMSSDVIRDMIAFRLNLKLRPQDFSIGRVLTGEPYYEVVEGRLSRKAGRDQVLRGKYLHAADDVRALVSSSLSQDAIEKVYSECEKDVLEALESDGWISLFPGKEMIESVAKRLNLGPSIGFQNSLIKELSCMRDQIDIELEGIFKAINDFDLDGDTL